MNPATIPVKIVLVNIFYQSVQIDVERCGRALRRNREAAAADASGGFSIFAAVGPRAAVSLDPSVFRWRSGCGLVLGIHAFKTLKGCTRSIVLR